MSKSVKTHKIDIYADAKSVSDVSAPFVKRCESGYMDNKEMRAIDDIISQLKVNGGLYYAILLIQFRGALRISEVLNISHQDFIDDNKVFIKGLKGSGNKLLHIPELQQEIIKWKIYKKKPFVSISRHSVYRFYKRLGIGNPKVKSKLNNVTHAIRNIVIRNLKKSNMTSSQISEIIGHKAKKSLEYYG
jgi:integrase